ncbi:MAG: hypothetical protein IRZ00_07595 [Gemmatimonadetes bacterium]|nr:hypothetical protein [Gemmatimonadota bacterium]
MLPRARTTRSPTTSTLSLLVVACALTAVPLSAQRARPGIPVVGVGFGVDTTAADVGDVVRLLRAYLAGPGVRSDSAARAAAFVDSVATLFATRPPEWIDYYVTASPDEYQRAIGLDFFPLPSGRGTGTGGQALMNVVLAGDPALGEGYLHELVHVVLASTCCGNAVVGEGIATLLAGSKGRSAREMWGVLAAFQRAHPDVKLRALLDGDVGGAWGPAENDALYATDALIVEAIYRDAGVAGLRRLTRVPAGTDAILDALRRALPAEANDLDRWWRRAPAEYAASDDASALRPQRRTRARARARRGRARTG